MGTLVSPNNKTDRNDITEILLRVALNTIALTTTSEINKSLDIRSKEKVKCFFSLSQMRYVSAEQFLFFMHSFIIGLCA